MEWTDASPTPAELRRYSWTFVSTFVAVCFLYTALGVVLAPAPIAAEYWIREMIVIKRSLVQEHTGQRKVLIASGSNALFNIDAGKMSAELGMPVLNLALHAGLPLGTILNEASRAAERGDTVLLPLEPIYYCDDEGINGWRARNAIAWGGDEWWPATSYPDRFLAVLYVGVRDIIKARIPKPTEAQVIARRKASLDDEVVLREFRTAPVPTEFEYSAFHLDRWGDMRATDWVPYRALPREHYAATPTRLCRGSAARLTVFVRDMKARGVTVFFAGVPFIDYPDLDRSTVDAEGELLAAELAPIAPMLERRRDLLLPRRHFLNTDLHLNNTGRAVRTERLLTALQLTIKR